MSSRHRCAMLAVAFIAGCAIWRPLPGAGFAAASSDHLHHARVVLRDGTRTEIDQATISRDSIVGLAGSPPARYAVHRSDVASVEAQRAEAITSFFAGVLAVFGALFLAGRLNSV